MKQIIPILIIILLIITGKVSAQISIPSPRIEYGVSQEVIRYAVSGEDSALGSLAGRSGSGQVWDMTNLEFQNLGVRKTDYLDGKALSGISDYNNVSFIISESYADTMKFILFILTDSTLQTIGELSNQKDSSTFMDVVYDPPITSAVFPLKYGAERKFNSAVYFGDFNFKLQFHFIVDAWGEIVTPLGREEVLRIKLAGDGEFAGSPISVNNYLFVTAAHVVIPVAEIQEIVYSGVSTYSATYRKFEEK
ncbi:MAG: hypothetical protein HUU54_16740 [Ignavibacteriaceae bacterium]|nr:hypothetical protein [Ignavibacteriaceae bacterium]